MQPGFSFQSVRPLTNLIWQARQGVLRRQADEVARLVGFTDKEMARCLGMSVRSLHSKTDTDVLPPAAGERLLLLERLIHHGLRVFDGRTDLLVRWLRTPLAELAYGDTTDQAESIALRSIGRFDEPVTRSASASHSAPVVPQSPLALLDMVSGFSLADDVLGRIEWGITG